MKKIYFVLLAFITTPTLLAQKISLPEIFALNKLEKKDFDAAMKKKGWTIKADEYDDMAGEKPYRFPTEKNTRVNKNFHKESQLKEITFQTMRKSYYVEFEKEVIEMGFAVRDRYKSDELHAYFINEKTNQT